jgi:hypothetical protein
MASFESTERHLTPHGWVEGTIIRDNGRKAVAPPDDRVMTVVWAESCGGYSVPVGSVQTTWQSKDQKLVESLLAKFGSAERDL